MRSFTLIVLLLAAGHAAVDAIQCQTDYDCFRESSDGPKCDNATLTCINPCTRPGQGWDIVTGSCSSMGCTSNIDCRMPGIYRNAVGGTADNPGDVHCVTGVGCHAGRQCDTSRFVWQSAINACNMCLTGLDCGDGRWCDYFTNTTTRLCKRVEERPMGAGTNDIFRIWGPCQTGLECPPDKHGVRICDRWTDRGLCIEPSESTSVIYS